MANDEIIIKVGTDVDKAQVQDLEDILNQLSNTTINFQPEVNTTQIQQLESEIEALESKAVLQEMFGDTSGVEQTQQQIEALQQQIETLKGSTQNIDSTGFDNLGQSADTARDSVEELGESVEAIGLMEAGAVLQQYGDQAEQMAQGMNQASITVGQLATQTGIAEPQLRNMIAGISNATFPTNEAMMYVKSLDQMGVSSNNLANSATGLDMINDAFGLGADKVNSLGQELGVLGVDMNNVGSSFNALAYANANTVGGMDNYFSFLRRYDSQFKELGLNVDQASVLIAGATQKFGGGRAAISGLSSILKESNGDLSVMEQKLGLTAGSLSNASQLTGQYSGQLEQMAQQEQDHKTILDQVGSAWDRLSLMIGDALSPISSLIGAGGQLIGVGTQLNGTIELLSKIKDFGNPFSGLSDHISNIKEKIIGLGSTIKDNLVGALRTLKTEVGNVASKIKDTLLTAFSSLKDTLTTSIIPAIQDAGRKLIELGKNALIAGANALKSVAMWIAEKVALAATTTWSYITAGAQAFLNAIMSMNPIMLVALALLALVAALVWAYQNIDWFRQMVDNAWQAITQLAGTIWGYFKGAFDMISETISGFTSKLGLEKDNWINSVLSFLIFIATLPIQLGVIFANAIAKALGFGDNFVQKMVKGAQDAVNGFINWISQLPGKLQEELNKMLDMAGRFAVDIGNKLSFGGLSAVTGWEGTTGEHSPGYMYDMFTGELKAMENAPGKYDIAGGMVDAGSSMVKSFNPNIGSSSTGVIGTNNITINIESVDNEDRIQEIVKAVEEALAFDNLTAGRTA